MTLPKRVIKNLSNFFDSYREKTALLRFLARKHMENEIILLICCYLDQLGGCLFPQGSSKRSFEKLLLTHSGESNEFSLVSVTDLCADIRIFAGQSDTCIWKPGRVQLVLGEQKPIMRFIDSTDIPLTGKSVQKFLCTICDSLKKDFRIYPNQTKNKECFGEEDIVVDSIIKVKQKGAIIREDHIKNLIREYHYSSILYREYRGRSVHELTGVRVNPDKFWIEKRPYFTEIQYGLLKFRSFTLEFSYPFLLDCLKTCIDSVEKAIIGKGLLPLPVWRAICEPYEFEFMDVELLEEIPIRLKID